MSKVKNPYNRVFSVIFQLCEDRSINASEKIMLKEAVFKDEAQILNFIKEFNDTQEEEKLKRKFVNFIRSKRTIKAKTRQNTTKNWRTEIGKPRTDQFSPRLSSDSKLNLMLFLEKPNVYRPSKKLNSLVAGEKKENWKRFANSDQVKLRERILVSNFFSLMKVRENNGLIDLLNLTIEQLNNNSLGKEGNGVYESINNLKKALEDAMQVNEQR